jgi:cyanophycinase
MRRLSFLVVALSLWCGSLCAQGSLLLVGGGGESYDDWSDIPYRWLVTHAPNRKVLVLHYADTTTFFSGYFPWLSPCTVSNKAITTTAQANDSTLYRFILQFDGIFLRGGDQWQYVNLWRGTLAEKAIREVFMRGGVVGGTSAGEVVLSQIIFDARQASVAPRTALRNPLAAGITLTDDFLGFGTGFIADSHFFERGRLGRLPAFLAFCKQSKGREIAGVGIDANTALAIGPDGVGEVMGSGTVTLLRYTGNVQTTLVSGQPLSMKGLRFDQLTAGGTFSPGDGSVGPPPNALPYGPVAYRSPGTTVILDGSSAAGDWSSTSGSLRKLESLLSSPSDTIGIIAAATSAASVASVVTALNGRALASKALFISEVLRDDPNFAAAVSSCRGLVFAGNTPDSLARFLDSTTLAGGAFREVIARHSPLLFLSDDVLLAGDQGIAQMYRNIYGAYYGYLVAVRGLGVLRGLQCVPRLFESSDYIDNRASALFWLMVQGHLPFGFLLDNGTHLTITGSQISVTGPMPAMFVDARTASFGSLPTFKDPGKTNPRQNGGIINALFSVLRDGESVSVGSPAAVDGNARGAVYPSMIALGQNYPNPFNPTTTIGFGIPAWGHVTLRIYNALGQDVALLQDGEMDAGYHEKVFDARGLPSGVYWYRLEVRSSVPGVRSDHGGGAGSSVATRSLVLVR